MSDQSRPGWGSRPSKGRSWLVTWGTTEKRPSRSRDNSLMGNNGLSRVEVASASEPKSILGRWWWKKGGFNRVVRMRGASNLVAKLKKRQINQRKSTMRKTILILGAAVALVGCNKEQGSTSDQYGNGTGTGSSMSNAPSSRPSTSQADTNSAPSSAAPSS